MLRAPSPVVSIGWLRDHRDDPDLRIVDARWSLTGPPGREAYDAGHLPGAIFLDLDRELAADPARGPGRHPLPSGAELARTLGSRGIGDEHTVVAYDDAGGSVASRIWWLFRHFGHDASVLDGGIAAWTAAGGELTTEVPEYPRATWTPRPARDDVVDHRALVAGRDAGSVLLDARAVERYRGDVEPVDPVAGHIPHAKNVPFAHNTDKDGKFLPVAELRAKYEAALAGARPQDTAFYCGSGATATHDILAMEVAGLPGSALYPGSWSEWIRNPMRRPRRGADP